MKSKKNISQETGLLRLIKEAKENRIWRYVTGMLAVLVVFVTAYVLIVPSLALSSSDLTPALTIESMTVNNAVYDGDEYTADFYITLADITTSTIDTSKTYYVVLPEGVTLENYSGSTLPGYDANGTQAFTYEYYYTDDTNVLYAAVTFLDTYIKSAGDTLTGGWFKYSAEISSSNVDDNYNIELKAGDVECTVKFDEITVTSTDSNPAGDLSVSKQASSYDSSTNSITYTVTVSSLKGTVGNISLEDTITSTLGVNSVDVTSVQYYYTSNEWGNTSQAENVSDVTSSYSTETGVLSMTLPALTSGEKELGSKYVIKYTVYLDSITDYSKSYTVGNSVKTSAETDWTGNGGGTITSTAEASDVNVSVNVLSKTGSADSDGNITWTITVNAAGVNIYGLTLTDSMFSSLSYNDLAAAISGGTGYGQDYEFTQENGVYTGIKFIDDVSGNNNTNTNNYTITYTTGASAAWASGTATTTNTATLTGDGLSSGITVGPSVTTKSGGISKSKNSVSYNEDGTVNITWTITGTIPSGGISAGTTLYDYLGGSSAYETMTTQWFTYDQVNAMLSGLETITLDGTYTTLSHGSTGDYTVEFYSVGLGDGTGTTGWIEMQNLYSQTDYSGYYFTAFRITFNNDITVSNSCSFSLTYTTTADRSTIDGTTVTSLTYKNNVEVVGTSTLTDEASHTEGAYVIKTDGNGNTGSSDVKVDSNGTLTWIVKAYYTAGSTDTFTITDTLPENVALISAKVAVSWDNCTLTLDSMSGTINSGSVTGEIATSGNQQVVTITVPSACYNWVGSSDYITITYTCQLDESLLTTEGEDDEGNTTTVSLESGASVGTFSNSVSVSTSSNALFGTASQSQTATYSSSSSTDDYTEVSKSYVWNSDSSTLTYTVIINPEEESLANGDNLSFVDTLTANHGTDWGVYAQLVTGSVSFYEAVSDGNGGYTKGNKLSIPWTYSQSSADWSGYISVYHIISSTSIPDATAIILEYQYEAWLDPYDADAAEAGKAYSIHGISNEMVLEGEYKDKSESSTSDTYTDSHFSAGIGTSTEVTITIVKVDSENYSTTLADAVYTLYKWSGSEWTSIGTYTTDSNGMISIGKSNLGNDYATDTGYKLVETTAPDGYFLDSKTEYYFYWSGSGTECYPDGWDSTSAHNLTKSSATEYAENTAVPDATTTSISVNKEWVDVNGTALDDSEVEATEVEVTLYRYEESDLEDEDSTEDETETETEEAETVDVYIRYNYNDSTKAKVLTINKNEAVTLVVDTGSDSDTLTKWALYVTEYWSSVSSDSSVEGQRTCEIAISSSSTYDVLYLDIVGSASSWSGTVTIKGDESTSSISGVNSSGLPHDTNGDYAGKAIDTYTITKANNWSLTVDDLTYQYYDEDNELHTYYYYFVETAVDGYYTTYSSSLGTTDGGNLTITNTQIPTTSLSVEKQWLDSDGTTLESGDKGYDYILDSIDVDLYRTEVAVDDSGSSSGDSDTVSLSVVYSNWSGVTTLAEESSIPKSTTVTVYFGYKWIQYNLSGNINGDTTTFTTNYYEFVIDTDTTITLTDSTVDAYIDTAISYSGQGSSSGGSTTTCSGADLPTDGIYVGTYTIEPDTADGSWSLSISNLPGGYVDDEGTLHNYYYYVRESSNDLVHFDTTYSSSSAVSEGTLTIYNTYNPDLKYTEARVEKIWLDSTSTAISDLSSYSATFQLIQVLQVTDNSTDSGYIETDGSILMIPYRSPISLSDSSSSWAARWVNLPTTATYAGETYSCIYFITETDATDGKETTKFDVDASISTENGSDSYTITVDGVTYYAVTVGDTSVDAISTLYVPTVTITNTSSEEEEDSTSITVTKAWSNVDEVELNGYTVTFQLVQLLKASDGTYYQSNGSAVVNYSTKDVNGDTIGYSQGISITGSGSVSYTWSSLPVTVTIDNTEYTCEYYIVEAGVTNASGEDVADQYTVGYSNGTETTYTDATGSTSVTYYLVGNDGTATVTNTYSPVEEPKTISFTVTKNWMQNDNTSLEISAATVTVQLLQELTAYGQETLYNQSSGTDVAYKKTISFASSNTGTATWENLPATMTIDNVEYTCSYYIVESDVVNGSGTPIASSYTTGYTVDGSEAYSTAYAESGASEVTTYYAVSDCGEITITNTAKTTAVLPATGGSGSRGRLVVLGSGIVLLALMLIYARRRRWEVVD